MSTETAPDPRIEPVAASITQYERHDAADRNTARRAIEAADAADRAASVIRVRVDDATEERMALAQLGAEPGMDGYDPAKVWAVLSVGERRNRLECARAVLEALVTQ